MAGKELKATAKLFLDVSDAQSDAAKFVGDLKRKLRDIETAADKMSVFKDLVSYIGQADAALDALRTKNQDAFNHMFDGLDGNLKKAIESVFGMTEKQLGQFSELTEKAGLFTTKSSIKEAREFAKSINSLYESLGKAPPLKIDEFSRTVKPENIENIKKAVDGLSSSFTEVNDKIKSGFGIGTTSTSGGGGLLNEEVNKTRQQIQELETQIAEYKRVREELQKITQARESWQKDQWLDESISVEYTVSAVKELIEAYSSAQKAKADFEKSGDTSSLAYYKNLSKLAKTALQIDDIYENAITGDDEFMNQLKSTKYKRGNLLSSIDNIKFSDEFDAVFNGILSNLNTTINQTENSLVGLKDKLSNLSATDNVADNAVNAIGQAADSAKKKVDVLKQSLDELLTKGSQMQVDVAQGKSTGKESMSLIGGNGVISTVSGQNYAVDTDALVGQLLANLKQNIVMSLHNHPDGMTFSPSDIQSFADLYYGQGTKIHGIIADGIVKTIDFTGISQEVAKKIAESYSQNLSNLSKQYAQYFTMEDGNLKLSGEISKYRTQDPDKYNNIMATINELIDAAINDAFTKNGVESTLKGFSQSDLSSLTNYIKEIQTSGQNAIAPIEKLKNLISSLHPNQNFDWSKYTDIFKQFESGAIDGTQAINKVLDLKTVEAQIDQTKAKVDNLMQSLQRLNDQASVSNNVNELSNIVAQRQQLLQAAEQEGILTNDVLQTQKEITAAIEQRIAAQQAGQQKFNDISAYATGLEGKNFYAWDDVTIGQSIAQIDAYQKELAELASQGIITAEQLQRVGDALNFQKGALENAQHGYTSYSGGYSYYYEFQEASAQAEQLRAEITELKAAKDKLYETPEGQLAFFEGMSASADRAEKEINELEAAVKKVYVLDGQMSMFDDTAIKGAVTKINAGTKAQDAASTGITAATTVQAEVEQLEVLRAKLDIVKGAIEAKTQAFVTEGAIVGSTVQSEISSLNDLLTTLEAIAAQAATIGQNLSNINANAGSLSQLKDIGGDTKGVFKSEITSALSKFDLDKAKLSKLIAIPDSFNDQIAKTRQSIEEAVNNAGLKIAINNWTALQNEIRKAATEQDLYNKKTKESKDVEIDEFTQNKTAQSNALEKYKKDLKDADYGVENLQNNLKELGTTLQQVTTQAGLDEWVAKFEAIKNSVNSAKTGFVTQNNAIINTVEKELNRSFNKLSGSQKEDLVAEYAKVISVLRQKKEEVKDGKAVELASIKEVTAALQQQINLQLAANQAAKAATAEQNRSAKFGNTKVSNAELKYNALMNEAKNFSNSAVITDAVNKYTQAYNNLIATKQRLSTMPSISTDDEAQFNSLVKGCNNYALALEKIIKSSLKLKNSNAKIGTYALGEDFVDNKEGRIAALTEFVNSIVGANAASMQFKNGWNEVVFSIQNSDGTFTQATASFTAARNEIVALAGDTKQATTAFQTFMGELKGKFRSISTYMMASFSIYRIWSTIKQGVGYVKEIDTALTNLKKVTDETDATYSKFLQSMSKTGATIGSTVADLTTMAAEWGRLGYSLEDSAKLAESTGILLNVSEFQDATAASEALISTMQAFQYTADESGHVVDILNEVGNNYAVSSDGIATALQDSASALMEAGNNLEQSVALVAAANKVVQDPNSVGSALRTISLRLRGTSVKVLEEMGEETDNVIESTSKLQSKIQALSGVNILTDSGEYKSTYDILKEIGTVWEEMSDIDQAALLELMAGKNRANTLSAILSNMEDLGDAYESALNAEGSALKENETYLDSIQGRIDLFNNAVQTMWMNFTSSEAIKFIVDLGTGFINAADKVGVLTTAVAGLLTYFSLSPKFSFDLASMLGIHKKGAGFIEGFSIFGKQGLTGWIANQLKPKTKSNNIVTSVLGDKNTIQASVQDFADGIRTNISKYVSGDTFKEIDDQIASTQNKLAVATKQLNEARSKDWNYYKKLGSAAPAKDRDARIETNRQQVRALESELAALQAKRADIESSVVNTTAKSMHAQVQQEQRAYTSMFSVLNQVKGQTLSVGNELDAAAKITEMTKAASQGQVPLAQYVSTLSNADVALKAYAASVTDGKYSLAGFQQFVAQHNAQLKASGVAAKTAAIGHQFLNTVLSMGMSMLASVAINAVIGAFDKLIETSEEVQEKALEAGNAIKELSSDFKKTEKFVTSNVDRFAELAQGVDMLSGKNLSLTADDYEEFLSLSNQLADVFPSLSRNYDENGNAIVQLSGSTDTIVSSLENLLEVQRQLAHQKIAENLPDLYDGAKLVSDGYRAEIDGLETSIKYYQRTLEAFGETDVSSAIDNLMLVGEAVYDGSEKSRLAIHSVKKALEDIGIETIVAELSDSNANVTGYSLMLAGNYASEQLQAAKKQIGLGIAEVKAEYNNKLDELNADLQRAQNANKANWSSLSSALSSWLFTEPEYKILDDNMQSMIQTVINNLDYAALDFKKWEDAQAWIEDNIFELFTDNNLKNKAAAELSEMFNLQSAFQSGKIDLGGFKKQVESYVNFVKNSGIAEEAQEQLLKMFEIDPNNANSLGESIDVMLNHAKSVIDTSKEAVESELERFGKDGAVDLLVRPKVSASVQLAHGWEASGGDFATVLTNTFSNEDGTIAMNFTPIIVDENGNYQDMLSPEQLQEYAEDVIDGVREDDLNLKLGTTYEGENAIEKAVQDAKTIHELQDNYFLDNIEIPFDKLSYSDLQIMNSSKFNVDGSVIATWEQLQQEIKEAKIAMTQDFTTDNFADYADNVDKISSSIATYKEALENLESGSFTITDFMELIAEFPDLADGVDLASGEFKGLASNLSRAIRNSPDELVDELYELKNSLEMAGKSTDAIDQLIESVQNMPTDAIAGLSGQYVTLTEQINAAKIAQNELNEAMGLNPNENYETRGDAIEQMKGLMKKGLIGSESELWNIAEAFFGDNPDALAAIADKNADALFNLINARKQWYAKDKDGNYTYEGTESFIEDVETVVKGNDQIGQALQELGVTWEYANGEFKFDFNNADMEDIVNLLSQTEELAGLTSEEFYDLLMQIGQFFKINWEDADDLIWFMDKINQGTESAAENFEATRGSVQSFLEQKGISLDWLHKEVEDLNADGIIDITVSDEFKSLPEDVQKVLEKYYELKDKFQKDPLSVNFQLNKDKKQNLQSGLTKDSLSSINQLVSTAHDESSGVTWFSFDDLSAAAEKAGMDVETLMTSIEELEKAGKVINLQVSTDDPFGLVAMQHDAETTKTYIEAIGLAGSELGDAFTIDVPSLVNMLSAAGWTPEQISAYMTQLNNNGQGYKFTITTETGEVEEIAVGTEASMAKIQELVTKAEELSETRNIGVNISGTANGALSTMKRNLDSLTGKTHKVKVDVEVTGDPMPTPPTNGNGGVNGTAHAQGTAYKSGSWGATKTETALVGELGPELLVRGNRWTTIGQHGAEFRKIRKGDIIFNHKQTEDLLSKGYVTGRGKAYASGTAYASGGGTHTTYDFGDTTGSGSTKQAAEKIASAADEFKEVFDWIEVRIEEITEVIDLQTAKLENAIGYYLKNNIVDDMIAVNKQLYDNLIAGAQEYDKFAQELLKDVPAQYREMAKNGSIAIETFAGEADEKELEAIQRYREWVQKGAEVTQQAEETLTEISNLAKEAFDNIVEDFENRTSLGDSKKNLLEAYNDLAETSVGAESEEIYRALMQANNDNIAILREQRNAMQAELNEQVNAGNIKKYSDAWYEAVNAISEVDAEIIDLTTDTYDYQDAINDLHWDHFDNLLSRIEAISDESENLIEILGAKDLFNKDTGEWTDEGITTLGLYAQQMEIAEMQAKKYEEEISYLNENWQNLGYTEQEYAEELEDLKDGQYEAIKAYNDTQDAIVDLNSARIDSIKEGIQKEIDAYDELINKKKEELNSEKDLYDFQKGVTQKQKEIAEIERKLAALSADNSASAGAKRAKLEADLLKARAELDEMYYDRSIEDQQNALDKELENFQKEKDQEIKGWDEYLENTEQVVFDSLTVITSNTEAIYQTLTEMGIEYGLTIADALTSPWQDGEEAIQSYSEKFGLAMSSTVEELRKVAQEYEQFMDEIDEYGQQAVKNVEDGSKDFDTSNSGNESNKTEEVKPIAVGGKIDAGSAKIYDYAGDTSGADQYYASDPIYDVLGIYGNWIKVRHKSLQSGVSGWFKKSDVKGYAKGTTGITKDQLAIIDELGEELRLVPDGNGRLAYLAKGTGIVPADLTANLMEWGTIDPSEMLERSKPQIGISPSVVNNTSEINIDASVGELIHVEHMDGNNPAEISKIVDKAWDKRMKELNGFVRKYSR